MLLPRKNNCYVDDFFAAPAFFEDFFGDDFFGNMGNKELSMMKTDIKHEDGKYKLEVELPGYNKEDITAELKDGNLTISAVTKTEDEKKDDKGNYLRRERYFGSCKRSFYVGKDVTENDINAGFENGVLKLEFPDNLQKKEDEKKLISIA